MKSRAFLRSGTLALGLLAGLAGFARAAGDETPTAPQFQGMNIDQKLGAQLPLDAEFKDEAGKTVTLGSYFGKRPVVLVLAYYECPMLCTLVLNGVETALNVVDLNMGKDFEVVTVSFNPRETPALAAAKKQTYTQAYRRGGAQEGWHFLTGTETNIHRVTEAVGFHYKYDEKTDQYYHSAGIMVATPDGVLSKYFYGIEFSARDLRLGLVDASNRRIGKLSDVVLLLCMHYDPITGRYGFAAMTAVRVAGLITVALMVTFIIRAVRR
jgi:protein SCO1